MNYKSELKIFWRQSQKKKIVLDTVLFGIGSARLKRGRLKAAKIRENCEVAWVEAALSLDSSNHKGSGWEWLERTQIL